MNKYIFLLIILSACNVNKNNNTTSIDLNALHDIWALTALNGESFDRSSTRKHPTLEIHVADRKYMGNDGCNSIFGSIEKLTPDAIKFGMMAGTKMMCPNKQVSNDYAAALQAAASFKRKELNLYFFDNAGNEVLVYKKVD
ncbi:META domain-containing protein [Bacteroidia bacterium]|nr:META domain-containing protein [Bacteroidia bacterium]MDC1395021.1 META domain-containing protein [Bacteroidia bacterium]